MKKTTAMTSVLLALFSGGAAASCASSGEPEARIREHVELEVGRNLARVTRFADGHMGAELVSLQGKLLVSATLRQEDAGWRADFTLPVTSRDGAVVLQDPAVDPPFVGQFLDYVFDQLGSEEARFDNKGCDSPMDGFSCGEKGACCDAHDDCFSRYGCSAASWVGVLIPGASLISACVQCNDVALACFASPFPVGPSTCCACNDCGKEWPAKHDGHPYSFGTATTRGVKGSKVTCATVDNGGGPRADLLGTVVKVVVSIIKGIFGSGGGPTSWGGGYSGSMCFVAGTPVTLADGSTRAIEAIRVGDVVLAYDERTGTLAPHAVTQTFAHPVADEPIVVINGALQATGNHPFFVDGRWVRADHLSSGDPLTQLRGDGAGIDRHAAGVSSLATSSAAPPAVFNLEVEGAHTYFAGGVLVHNKPNGFGTEGYGGLPRFKHFEPLGIFSPAGGGGGDDEGVGTLSDEELAVLAASPVLAFDKPGILQARPAGEGLEAFVLVHHDGKLSASDDSVRVDTEGAAVVSGALSFDPFAEVVCASPTAVPSLLSDREADDDGTESTTVMLGCCECTSGCDGAPDAKPAYACVAPKK